MARTRYDLTIIGGGSGGLAAARIAVSLGAKVLLVDKEQLGGDCLRYGCVPSKSLLYAARLVHEAKEAMGLELDGVQGKVDMAKVSAYVQKVIGRVAEAEEVYAKGASVRFGEVAFLAPTRLLVQGEEIESRTTIIATGSSPAIPLITGLEEVGYLTNRDVFDLNALPETLVIAGGGPVGVELAQAFARLGAKVTLLQRRERLLSREEPEVSEAIAAALAAEGVTILTNARLVQVERRDAVKVMTVQQKDRTLTIEAAELVLALGRRPNLDGLNLEKAGIKRLAQGIQVNEYLQTTAAPVYAIGDVIGGNLFTHVAAYQAKIAVRNALIPFGRQKVDYRVVPWCTFTDPEAARIGLRLDEARKQYAQVRVVTLPWSEIDRAQTENEARGFLRLVLAGKKDEIVGAHIVGGHAGELLGELAIIMQHHLSLNDIFNTIHAYPTLNTGIQQVAAEAYYQSRQAARNRRIVRALLKVRR